MDGDGRECCALCDVFHLSICIYIYIYIATVTSDVDI